MGELITDTELIRQMRNGDQSAFAALYRRHHPALYRYAILRCGSTATAADVVQDVFMGLMSGQFQFDALRGSLPSFLFGVARNLAMKFDATNRHRFMNEYEVEMSDDDDEVIEIVSEELCPLEKILNNQLAEELRVAIGNLAPHYRDVLILYELQEMSYLDIADICQINVGTVRSRLSRARLVLAERLQAYRSEAA